MKTSQDERHNEIIDICKAFDLGNFITNHVIDSVNGYQLTEFKTTTGTFKHYFRIK